MYLSRLGRRLRVLLVLACAHGTAFADEAAEAFARGVAKADAGDAAGALLLVGAGLEIEGPQVLEGAPPAALPSVLDFNPAPFPIEEAPVDFEPERATAEAGEVEPPPCAPAKPAPAFDRPAPTALRQWAYRPATRDGRPVESRHLVRFVFKLNG